MNAVSAEQVAHVLRKVTHSGGEYRACCPAHDDEHPSFTFRDGDRGVMVCCHANAGCTYPKIADALKALGVDLRSTDMDDDYPHHPQLGRPASVWDYRDAAGRVVLRACRWDRANGGKEIRPSALIDGRWSWTVPAGPRPLFQLDRLLANPDRPVMVVEGEKTADAAQALFPQYTATTWPCGAAAVGRVDLTPLKGRDVTLVPDCDEPGRGAMQKLERLLQGHARSVRIVDPGKLVDGLPAGWDLADALAEGRDVSGWLADSVEPPDTGSHSSLIDWKSKIGREPPARAWRINDWLPVAPALIAGLGGAGKSLLMQAVSTSLATGKSYIAEVPEPVKSLTWSCEDPEDEVWRRQHAINEHFEVGYEDLQGRMHVDAREGLDNTLMTLVYGVPQFTPLFDTLRKEVNDLAIDVLVLDNLGHVFGGNESDRHQATLFVNRIKGIVTGRPFTVVLVGHTARSEGSEYSGSAAWENACRMRWFMGSTPPGEKPDPEEERDPGVIYLAKRKSNHSTKDRIKLRYEGGLFVPEVQSGISVLDPVGRRKIADQVVLNGFDKLLSMGISTTDGNSSPDYLPKQLKAKRLDQGCTLKETTAAMNRLMVAKVLKRAQVGTYSNRSVRMGLVRS